MTGWARVVSEKGRSDGWDGCIDLSGGKVGSWNPKYDFQGGYLNNDTGAVWGSNVFGWASLKNVWISPDPQVTCPGGVTPVNGVCPTFSCLSNGVNTSGASLCPLAPNPTVDTNITLVSSCPSPVSACQYKCASGVVNGTSCGTILPTFSCVAGSINTTGATLCAPQPVLTANTNTTLVASCESPVKACQYACTSGVVNGTSCGTGSITTPSSVTCSVSVPAGTEQEVNKPVTWTITATSKPDIYTSQSGGTQQTLSGTGPWTLTKTYNTIGLKYLYVGTTREQCKGTIGNVVSVQVVSTPVIHEQ